ncbi:MAG TPA: aminotransferase class V-fold PLP-dependent enzyme [Anaerolineales bacterium]|nr:aminotransferase class V-fold PLP-dependent enzyme [Anaerolineales bacterium]
METQFLLDPQICFLNHGSFGATPLPVFREYQRWQAELERQPVEFLGRRHDELMRNARLALGRYLGTGADHLVFTQNVTISVNIVARSLELGRGDEVLASNHEYGACDRTWRFLAGERGFDYVNRPMDLPLRSRESLVDDFWRGVTPRTRLIFLSHITSPTAIRLPVEDIIQQARTAGIFTLIDGAHAPGQVPLHLDDLGADFYGGNLHKWLCAPKGAGFLFARPDVQHLLKPLVVSWGYEADNSTGSTFVDYFQWWGTRDIAAFLSVPAAIEFQERYEWPSIRTECHALLAETLKDIQSVTGIPSFYPDDSWYVQMASIPLPPSTDIARVKSRLYDEFRVEVPLVDWNGHKLMRISVQGYNTTRDRDRLVEALAHLL